MAKKYHYRVVNREGQWLKHAGAVEGKKKPNLWTTKDSLAAEYGSRYGADKKRLLFAPEGASNVSLIHQPSRDEEERMLFRKTAKFVITHTPFIIRHDAAVTGIEKTGAWLHVQLWIPRPKAYVPLAGTDLEEHEEACERAAS